MIFQQTNFFIQGWRGFLLGRRRGWHAHHRIGIQGVRSGYLVCRPGLQLVQLRRVASFVVEVFSRGGSIWGFGFPGLGGSRKGIQWWPEWKPGILSNSFFTRVARIQRVRQLRRLVMLRPRRRKVLRRRKFRRRRNFKIWSQRRREGRFSLSILKRKPLRRAFQKLSVRAALIQGIRDFQSGWAGGDLLPRGSKLSVSVPHRPPGFFPVRGGFRLWNSTRLRVSFNRSVRAGQLRRTRRCQAAAPSPRWSPGVGLTNPVPKTTPAGAIFPTRGILKGHRRRRPGLFHRRRWCVNPGLPTVILLAEFGGAGTIYRESLQAGVPLVVVGSARVNPTVSVCPLWWNPTALEGPRRLLNQLPNLAQRVGLFTMLWSRLSCLAEW